MDKAVLQQLATNMDKSIEALEKELSRVRTGRASVTLLDGVRVDYYGTPTPLNQLATISIPEPRLITIQPWDASVLKEIEKAIQKADLGLTPTSDGKIIRVAIPPLTEDRRKELVKLVKKMAENAKVAIRNHRRKANDDLKALKNDKKISEDDYFKGQEEVQKKTDDYIKKCDDLAKRKEDEILSF
ncbi:MAG: ribosome recycling factor [Desulfobacterota bacterium]|nr:ribosome recycling factor [Thermodesulfobacteriota bacterium]